MIRKLIILLLLFPEILGAQKDSQLVFEKIEGLSQNTVYNITKDKQGFLWIATADGLNRFDGVQMKIYKPSVENKKGTYQGRIIRSKLVEDQLEQIWFFSSGSGLYSYNKQKDFFEPRRVQLNKESAAASFEPILAEGFNLWGASWARGVINYNFQTSEWRDYPVETLAGADFKFSAGMCDDENNFWFIAKRGILFFDKNTKKWQHLFQDTKFIGTGYSKDTLYLQTETGLFACNTTSLKLNKIQIENQPSSSLFNIFFTDKKNNVWTGDLSGNIYCKSNGTGIFKWRGNINGESTTNTLYPVYSLYVDDNDILWAGADVLGLQKAVINPPRFNIYPTNTKSKKENSLFIHSIYEDENKNIWLGTFRQGIIILNGFNKEVKKIQLPLESKDERDNNSIKFISKDSKGNLWVGHTRSLFVREKGETKFKRVETTHPDEAYLKDLNPYSMTEVKDSIFFATSMGIYKVIKIADKFVATHLSKTGIGFYTDLFIDNEKNYWLAFEGGVFRQKNLYTTFGSTPGDTILFGSTTVKSFLYDSAYSLLWISSAGGLIAYHFPTGKYKNYSETDGLGNSYVYGVLKSKNDLWLSTNNGLSKAALHFKKGAILPEIVFTNFARKDGLPDNEFNSGAYYKGGSGNLYFGSLKGAVWFNPDELLGNPVLPQIVMTNLLVNEEKADSAIAPEYIQQLTLPYYKNNLFFQFRGIEYSNAVKVSYAYQLVGWDKDWVYSGTLNQVRYNNLPAGKYTFKIKAANASGLWGEKSYSVSITIHPPFWKTWWFYSLCFLLIIILVIGVTRSLAQRKFKKQLDELEKQNEMDKERQRISKEMHDDIGAGLTQITLMSESVKNKIGITGGKELNDIGDTSRKLVSNMSEIIWSLNPEYKTLDQLMAYMREQLLGLLDYSGMQYSIELPESSNEIILTNQQRRNILLATKEIVHNAVKHSDAKEIWIKGIIKNNDFEMEIKDNGKGVDVDKVYRGNGLKNIRHRVEEIGGNLLILSEPGEMTKFFYSIPITATT